MRTNRRARCRILLGWTVIAGLWVVMVATLFAQQAVRPASSETAAGILLMKNGAIIRGRILPGGESYVVKQSHGEMVVPTEMVHGEYRDLADAYLRLKEEWPQPTADRHLALARWCVSQNMLEEARAELKSALALEPGRDDIRNTLQKLNNLMQPGPPASSSPWDVQGKTGNNQRPAPTVFEDAESLGGLSREAAVQFTRKVQPILMNNCATASCHGPESKVSDFQLQPVHVGGHTSRVATERNLAEVLIYISRQRPGQSPLVTKPVGNHGTRGRPVFQGTRGADQLRELKKWAELVSTEEISLPRVANRERTGTSENPLSPSQAMIPSNLGESDTSSSTNRRPSRVPANLRPGSPLGIPPVDEFDPDIFNRRHHGVATKKD